MPDQQSTSRPATDTALPDLPGINLEAGLQVSRHNRAMYRRLLLKFRDSWADYRQVFDAAPGDAVAVCDLAHNLKGVAANLGIEQVQRLAAELEASYRESPADRSALDFTAAARKRLFDELDRVLAGLRMLD